MENEFYLGYVRNPKDVIKNGFQEKKEYEIIVEKDYNDYREVCLREKIYLVNPNEVVDGHQVLKNQAGLVGRIGRKLTKDEAMKMITVIRETKMDEYIETLRNLINDTREMYLQGEQEYKDEVAKFIDYFQGKDEETTRKI